MQQKMELPGCGESTRPKFEDVETTLPELKARTQQTLDFLASVPAAKLDGTEATEVMFPAGFLSVRQPIKLGANIDHAS